MNACMDRRRAGGMGPSKMCCLFYGGGKEAAEWDSRARFGHRSNGLTRLFFCVWFLKKVLV